MRLLHSNLIKDYLKFLRGSESGSALLELALTVPFLVLLLIGVIDLGRAEHYNILLESAARAGVQYGAQNSITAVDNAGITSASRGESYLPGITVTPSTFCQCADGSASTCSTGDCLNSHFNRHVNVVVSGKFNWLFSYFGVQALTISRSATLSVIP